MRPGIYIEGGHLWRRPHGETCDKSNKHIQPDFEAREPGTSLSKRGFLMAFVKSVTLQVHVTHKMRSKLRQKNSELDLLNRITTKQTSEGGRSLSSQSFVAHSIPFNLPSIGALIATHDSRPAVRRVLDRI